MPNVSLRTALLAVVALAAIAVAVAAMLADARRSPATASPAATREAEPTSPADPTPSGVASQAADASDEMLRTYCGMLFPQSSELAERCIVEQRNLVAEGDAVALDPRALERCRHAFGENAELVRICHRHQSAVLAGLRRHNSEVAPSARD